MMTSRRHFLTLLLTGALSVGLLAGDVLAGKGGGKPPKDDPPVDPPALPFLLQPHIFCAPDGFSIREIYDTNSRLETVGSLASGDSDGDNRVDFDRAYLYAPKVNSDFAVDLNDIVTSIPAGWAICRARSINEYGDIAAYLEPIATPGESLQVAMIDMSADGLNGVLHVVDDRSFTDYLLAVGMNDLGEILAYYGRDDGTTGLYLHNFGLYDPNLATSRPIELGVDDMFVGSAAINNVSQIVYQEVTGEVVRFSLDGSSDTFFGLGFPRSMNGRGEFCGSAYVETGKGKYKGTDRPYVVTETARTFNVDTQARDINDEGDFVTPFYVYHRGLGQAFDPESLLDPTDPNTATFLSGGWFSLYVISNQDPNPSLPETGFPAIAGWKSMGPANSGGCLHIPVPVPEQ